MDTGRDRLRELLDAVLAEDSASLGAMAATAFASPYHFHRQLRRGTGEPPVAMRRRVMLERASWQVRRGSSVTDAALAAGFESVEGFARAYAKAYGHPPSATPREGDHRLPAPNGIHFHPPTSLWVDATEHTVNPVTELMVGHDLHDSRTLLDLAKGLDDDAYRREHLPGATLLAWDGPEGSLAGVLEHLVRTKEVWLAAIAGEDTPPAGGDDPAALLDRLDAVGPRWRAAWRDVERRGGWDDVLVDALCDPPESFVLSSVLAHVLTYSAHRRQQARVFLRLAGRDVDDGDPITHLRERTGA